MKKDSQDYGRPDELGITQNSTFYSMNQSIESPALAVNCNSPLKKGLYSAGLESPDLRTSPRE